MCKPVRYITSTTFIITYIILFVFNINVCCSCHVLINEVFYNPPGEEKPCEWVEIFNPSNDTVNLTGWLLQDNYENDSLEGDYDHGNGSLILPPHGYAIITPHNTTVYDLFSIPNNTLTIYVDDNAIGNGLSNCG